MPSAGFAIERLRAAGEPARRATAPLLSLAMCLFLMCFAVPAAFAEQSGVALLIGNATYPDAESPLQSPVSDAHALADQLKRQGFDVVVDENLKKEAMRRSLSQFYEAIKANSTALIYFGGFGIQSDRHSYLIPVDAQIWNENDVRRDGFSLDKILAEMTSRGARAKIAIVDASRRNPFERRFRSVSAGLAAVTAPSGTMVMTSAPPDIVINDEDDSGVFMASFIKELAVPGATVEQIFNRTRTDVSRATKQHRVPWLFSSLEQDFALAKAGSEVAAAPQPSPNSRPPDGKPTAQPKPSLALSESEPNANVQPKAGEAKPAAPRAAPKGSATNSGSANGSAKASPPPAPPVISPDPEAEARHDYVTAENLGTKQGWDDFIKKYPSGYYHDLAHAEIAKLTAAGTSPTDLAGFYRRGKLFAIEGDFDLAIRDLSEVIRRDPKHAGALNNRCWVRGVVGDLQDALKDCNAALQIAPNYPDALDSRGMIELKMGMIKNAIADYDATLRIEPNRESALYGRGVAKLHGGDEAAGKSDIEAAKKIKPTIADEFASYGIR